MIPAVEDVLHKAVIAQARKFVVSVKVNSHAI
jgi:hypothetical protein